MHKSIPFFLLYPVALIMEPFVRTKLNRIELAHTLGSAAHHRSATLKKYERDHPFFLSYS